MYSDFHRPSVYSSQDLNITKSMVVLAHYLSFMNNYNTIDKKLSINLCRSLIFCINRLQFLTRVLKDSLS